MQHSASRLLFGVAFFLWALAVPIVAQPIQYHGARTADGKPNLNGYWQAITTADWDIQPHMAESWRSQLGAIGAMPPGLGIVEGGEIPYKPDALAKRKTNYESRLTADPEIKCYLPGVPRAMYMPYPFQIVQTPGFILMNFQFASAVRSIRMGAPRENPVDTWMGESAGRWEGDVLSVDVQSFNAKTWFDRSGNYHSDELHLVERYTPVNDVILSYEVTVEDPKVFTRPWKMSFFLYRIQDKNFQMLEFKCVEFVEELMYGPLSKKK